MQLISINIGQEQTLVRPTKTVQTGIFKRPVAGPAQITKSGLPDDFIGDFKDHGGPDQAIYIYGAPDYDWWAIELDRELAPGTFGENLTISELASADFSIGDRLLIGDSLILEVTAPRIPCGTLATCMGIPAFAKQFRFAERPGLYCRVIAAGTVQAGDSVQVEKYSGATVSLLEVYRDHYQPELTQSAIQRILAAPVAIRIRAEKQKQLQELLEASHD